MRAYHTLGLRSALLCAAAFTCGTAGAQTVSDEVVVTALKRSSNLQDTPLAISAISETTLEKTGATNIQDLTRSVPGLNITELSTAQRRITLRGIQAAGEATVGLFYDETPVTGPSSSNADPSGLIPDLNLFDVERVEVLRGPQGTLYGAGSMSGTMRVIFKKPNTTEYEGAVDSRASWTDGGTFAYATRGMVNVPLIEDKLGARMVLYKQTRPGYVDNIRLNQSDVNTGDATGGRLMLGFTPTDKITVQVAVHAQSEVVEDSSGWWPANGEYKSDAYQKLPYNSNFNLYSATGTWDLGFATATATGSHYRWRVMKIIDLSRQALSTFAAATYCSLYHHITVACSPAQRTAYQAWGASVFPVPGVQPLALDTDTAELRLSSNGEGKLDWTVGAYFEKRDDYAGSGVASADKLSGVLLQPAVFLGMRDIQVDTKQTALFGEVTYRPFEPLSLTFGARRFDYDKSGVTSSLIENYVTGAGVSAPFSADVSAEGWVKKFNVSYDITPDLMVYAQAGEGFRPGGINNTPGLPANLLTWTSDSLWNYEGGFKSAWFDNRLIFNVSAYRIEWKDMQTSARIPNFTFTANVGSAEINGVELEATARPFEGLSLRGTATFLDPTLSVDQVAAGINAAGRVGDRIPNEPKFTTSVSADYVFPVASTYEGMVHVDYSYTGKSYSQFRPTDVNYEEMGDFALVNARAGLEGPTWAAYLFADNLLNEVGRVKVSSSTNNEQFTFGTQPRTIGVSLRKRF